jgi:hypothetical protein
MALARIITRSQACSRELALDLLSRGYAVEIVSPDAVPDNLADLELRVEEDPGNQLVATVEAHNDGRTASLEFLHYLKAPMPEFARRTMESHQPAPLAEVSGGRIGEASVETIELPAEPAQPTAQTFTTVTETPAEMMVESAVSAPEMQATGEVPGYFPIAEPTVSVARAEAMADGLRQNAGPQRRWQARSAGWFWRTALTFGAVIVVALFLAFGARRIGRATGQSNLAALPGKSAAVSDEASPVRAADAAKVPAIDARQELANSPAMSGVTNASQGPARATVSKPTPAVEITRGVSRQRNDDVVARDTVTYLDKRFEPQAAKASARRRKPDKHLARHHRTRHSHGDEVIAANRVTYLDKPAPKPAK